jgi:hypothetical protein
MKYKKYIKTLIITELNEMNYNVEVEEGDSRVERDVMLVCTGINVHLFREESLNN